MDKLTQLKQKINSIKTASLDTILDVTKLNAELSFDIVDALQYLIEKNEELSEQIRALSGEPISFDLGESNVTGTP